MRGETADRGPPDSDQDLRGLLLSSDPQVKGSVQRRLRWVLNSTNRCVLAWDYCAGHYFEFLIHRRLVLNIFPFPLSTAKLLGDFYNSRQSAANSKPSFAYSFVFLMLRQYYWRYDSYSAIRRSAAANIKKIPENFILVLRIAPLRL
jgi:hypothetical protein